MKEFLRNFDDFLRKFNDFFLFFFFKEIRLGLNCTWIIAGDWFLPHFGRRQTLHYARRIAPWIATWPSWILHSAHATLQWSRRRTWSPGLHVLFNSSLWRIRSLNCKFTTIEPYISFLFLSLSIIELIIFFSFSQTFKKLADK